VTAPTAVAPTIAVSAPGPEASLHPLISAAMLALVWQAAQHCPGLTLAVPACDCRPRPPGCASGPVAWWAPNARSWRASTHTGRTPAGRWAPAGQAGNHPGLQLTLHSMGCGGLKLAF
jgi:hypothetical protein